MRLGLLALIAGCGRVAFDPLGGDGATGTDGVMPDVPIGVPLRIDELSDLMGDDDHAVLTEDRLEIFFCSNRTNPVLGHDIYTATRTSPWAPWGTPTLVTELSSSGHDYGIGITPDGLLIMFTSDRPPSMNTDIWVSTRSVRGATWSTPVIVPELSTPDEEHAPKPISPTRMVFARYTSTSDIWEATRPDAAAAWSATQIIEINVTTGTLHFDSDPHLTSDGLTIMFYSNRSVTGPEMFTATRPSLTQPFSTPTGFAAVSEGSDPWISDDLKYLVYTGAVAGRLDLFEIYLP